MNGMTCFIYKVEGKTVVQPSVKVDFVPLPTNITDRTTLHYVCLDIIDIHEGRTDPEDCPYMDIDCAFEWSTSTVEDEAASFQDDGTVCYELYLAALSWRVQLEGEDLLGIVEW